ncbi:MAG TPA: hypothetical protein VHM19_21665 [Polyangiales bacterium]|nr:hypothetical protein [Polyangiales bacterium]
MLCLLVASACVGPPPSKALIVRHPETKCALISFSGCERPAPPAPADEDEEDAGVAPEDL